MTKQVHANAHMYTEAKAKHTEVKCGPWPSVSEWQNAEKCFAPGNNNAISCALQLRAGGMLSTELKSLGILPAFNDVRSKVAAGYLREPVKPTTPRKNHVGKSLKVHKVHFVKAFRVSAKVKATQATGKATGKAKATQATTTKAKATQATGKATQATGKATQATGKAN